MWPCFPSKIPAAKPFDAGIYQMRRFAPWRKDRTGGGPPGPTPGPGITGCRLPAPDRRYHSGLEIDRADRRAKPPHAAALPRRTSGFALTLTEAFFWGGVRRVKI